MSDSMQDYTMKLIASACESYPNNNQNAAQMIKETMDTKYGASWHVVVGEQFGIEVSHEKSMLLYMFYGGNLAVCVWKCT